ncbi:unnamed protein product, partial [marine sediment metagenome]
MIGARPTASIQNRTIRKLARSEKANLRLENLPFVISFVERTPRTGQTE